ncbi:nucleoside triphosphate pyrophosphatase [Halobacteriovorax sp. HLS]|uniref:Maf family protein n=1 Tax=Halobacteriovorax sp. HLS TaxID=2234000 RepID=UPI000FD8421F|nr:Maf family protein [Halobacteriovorax sp. HLS]
MTSNKVHQLILASGSPRRKELLSWLDVKFTIISSDVEEVTEKIEPVEVAQDLAALKGRDVFSKIDRLQFPNPIIISSDTIVTYNGLIYGKPKNKASAREMLLELEGKTHEVITSVFFLKSDLHSGEVIEKVFSVSSKVTFEKIDRDLLDRYIESGESLDKAGSYGIQGRGLSFISNLDGSYSNVVGLPLSDFFREFKAFLGFENSINGEWRKVLGE